MLTTALSLVSTLIALLPSPHLKESLKALLALLIKGRGKARPQHTPLKSPSALSRFLNHYPWPTRLFIRTTRKAMERALLAQIAHRRRGPRPRLLVVIDLVTLPKRGCFPALPLSFFHGQWGLHLVVLYLVYGPLRLPWAYRVWRGKGEKTLSLLALRLLHTLPPWIPRRFRLRVVADSAFGTLTFLYGLHRLGYEGVVGMRRNRRLSDGRKLVEVRQGERVFLRGLSLPVWVVRYRYPRPGGEVEGRYVVSTFRATPGTVLVWGRRRFSIEVFFRVMKSELSFGCFGQRTALGVHRFLPLSLLAYLLVHWLRVEGLGGGGASWRESGERAVYRLFPELVWVEVHVLLARAGPWRGEGEFWGPSPLRDGCLCRLCGRCKK